MTEEEREFFCPQHGTVTDTAVTMKLNEAYSYSIRMVKVCRVPTNKHSGVRPCGIYVKEIIRTEDGVFVHEIPRENSFRTEPWIPDEEADLGMRYITPDLGVRYSGGGVEGACHECGCADNECECKEQK